MKKIAVAVLAIGFLGAGNTFAQEQTTNEPAPEDAPVATSVIDQEEGMTLVTPDSDVVEVPSIDVSNEADQGQTVAPIQTTMPSACGCQQVGYYQPLYTRGYQQVQMYQVYRPRLRSARAYTYQPMYAPAPRRLFNGRLFGGLRYR